MRTVLLTVNCQMLDGGGGPRSRERLDLQRNCSSTGGEVVSTRVKRCTPNACILPVPMRFKQLQMAKRCHHAVHAPLLVGPPASRHWSLSGTAAPALTRRPDPCTERLKDWTSKTAASLGRPAKISLAGWRWQTWDLRAKRAAAADPTNVGPPAHLTPHKFLKSGYFLPDSSWSVRPVPVKPAPLPGDFLTEIYRSSLPM